VKTGYPQSYPIGSHSLEWAWTDFSTYPQALLRRLRIFI